MEVIVLKGTPDEMAEFFAKAPGFNTSEASSDGNGSTPPFPGEVREWLDEWRIRGTQRTHFESVVRRLQGLPNVRFRITAGRKGEYRFAGRIGFVKDDEKQAFAFLGRKGRLVLRLDHVDARGCPHAVLKEVKAGDFRVHTYVRSEDAVEEAFELLRRAYEKHL